MQPTYRYWHDFGYVISIQGEKNENTLLEKN